MASWFFMVKRFVLAVCLFGLSLSTYAQNWKEDFTQAEKFYHNKNYSKALSFGEASLKKYQEVREEVVENQIAILRLLSGACYANEHYAKGLEYLNTEIQLLEKQKDTAYSTALMNKTRFQKQMGKHDLAVTSLLECHQLLAKRHKSKSGKLLECDLQIAIEYYLSNDFEKAREWFTASLHQVGGKKFFSAVTIEAAYFYGLLNLETNRNQEALKSFNNAIRWCEVAQLIKTFEYALVLNGLATAQNFSHAYSEAEKSFGLAQTVCESAEGNSVGYCNEILIGRAVNFQQLGKFFNVEMILKKTPLHHESKLPDLPILDSAQAYQASGDFQRSEELYQKALGRHHSDDKESLMTYAEINTNLSLMYLEKGDFQAALTRFAETRELIEKLYGYYHRKYVNVLNAMGFVYIKMESWVEAEASFRQSFQIMDRMLGKSEAERMLALAGMIEVEKGKGDFAKADSITTVAVKKKLSILKQVQLIPKQNLPITTNHRIE